MESSARCGGGRIGGRGGGETIDGKGTRWVRDITTYVLDDNMAFMEGSVRDVVRYVSYGHRTILEDRFTFDVEIAF